MTPSDEQIHEALSRIAGLLSAPLPEVVSKARLMVQDWPARDVAALREELELVAYDLAVQMPDVERMEREGFPIVFDVNGQEAGGLRVPIEGLVVKIQGKMAALMAVARALGSSCHLTVVD